MTSQQITEIIRRARERATHCPIHQTKLDPNGHQCADCLIVSRYPHLAGLFRPISEILGGSK